MQITSQCTSSECSVFEVLRFLGNKVTDLEAASLHKPFVDHSAI